MTRGVLLAAMLWAALAGTAMAAGGEPLTGPEDYEFPFDNAFAATVVGTPSRLAAELPDRVPKQEIGLTLFPERRIPELFWYNDQLRFSIVRQRQEAPLIFNIAGTGAGHQSRLMLIMERAFYQAGFHVISLPSPTHSNFISTASETQVPGLLADDARDMHRVMQEAYAAVADTIRVSEFYLTGYSLGAAQAAFVSKYDDDLLASGAEAFDFKKVLMINPPVSLFNSVEILDEMVEAIPGGMDNFNSFFERLLARFAEIYKEEDFLDLSSDFLYLLYKRGQPTEDDLRTVIGVAFRVSAANMLFVSDVFTRSGVVVRRNARLRTPDSLTNYLKVSVRVGFVNYVQYLLYPYFQQRRPGVRLDELIAESSLKAIEGYLRTSPKIGLMTNVDDIILAPGEIDYLKSLFGSRAMIFPKGGHCGNLPHRDNIAAMTGFFTEGWGAP